MLPSPFEHASAVCVFVCVSAFVCVCCVFLHARMLLLSMDVISMCASM